VPDPFRPQQIERVANGDRSGRFPGVRHHVKPGGAGPGEGGPEEARRVADLIAAKP
jgi:hypothetical protein